LAFLLDGIHEDLNQGPALIKSKSEKDKVEKDKKKKGKKKDGTHHRKPIFCSFSH
tara:strand:- start:3988 stop:4152 length:165 start_codon:yes stop_codon:yes gene_type:complete